MKLRKKAGDFLGLLLGVCYYILPAGFRNYFLNDYFSIYIYMLLGVIGILMIGYYFSKMVKIKAIYMFLFMVFCELLIFGIYKSAKHGYKVWDNHLVKARYLHGAFLRNIPMYDLQLGKYDKELFYTYKEGEGIHEDEEFSNVFNINSQGVRDDEASLSNPEILFLGDSFTMGWGSDQKYIFPSLVEKATDRKVLNGAVSSYGTAREHLLAKRFDLDSCDLIVWQFCDNDIEENQVFVENDFKLKVSEKEKYQRSQMDVYRRTTYFPFKLIFELSASKLRKYLFEKNAKKELSIEENIDVFFEIIKQFQQTYQGNILLLNLNSHKTTDQYFLSFKKKLSKDKTLKNIYLINTSEVLNENDYYVLDDHLNKKGHQKIADLILVALSTQLNKSEN